MNKYSKATKATFSFLNPPALQCVNRSSCDRPIPLWALGDVHFCLGVEGDILCEETDEHIYTYNYFLPMLMFQPTFFKEQS